MIQKSYKNANKNLYVIPTPIGNLSDISYRVLETFKVLDILLCEDTRKTGLLLKKFNIKLKLVSYHEYNNFEHMKKIETIFLNNHDVGLVSDAGFPLISDPGFELINFCNEREINFIVLPGPTSFLLPLIRSGFSIDKFSYLGFLKGSNSEKEEMIKSILKSDVTSVLFESKHKIIKTISCISKYDSERMLCIGRELTKKNEEYIVDTAENILKALLIGETRGEFVVVVESTARKELDYFPAVEILKDLELSKKDIAFAVGKLYNVSKNEVYKYLLENYE